MRSFACGYGLRASEGPARPAELYCWVSAAPRVRCYAKRAPGAAARGGAKPGGRADAGPGGCHHHDPITRPGQVAWGAGGQRARAGRAGARARAARGRDELLRQTAGTGGARRRACVCIHIVAPAAALTSGEGGAPSGRGGVGGRWGSQSPRRCRPASIPQAVCCFSIQAGVYLRPYLRRLLLRSDGQRSYLRSASTALCSGARGRASDSRTGPRGR